MRKIEEKDALTDLVEIPSPDVSNQPSNNGEVTDSSGGKVTLNFKVLARKLLRTLSRKKETRKAVKQYLRNKDAR